MFLLIWNGFSNLGLEGCFWLQLKEDWVWWIWCSGEEKEEKSGKKREEDKFTVEEEKEKEKDLRLNPISSIGFDLCVGWFFNYFCKIRFVQVSIFFVQVLIIFVGCEVLEVLVVLLLLLDHEE